MLILSSNEASAWVLTMGLPSSLLFQKTRSFSKKVWGQRHISLDNMSASERNAAWLSSEESDAITESCLEGASMLESSGYKKRQWVEDIKYCARGWLACHDILSRSRSGKEQVQMAAMKRAAVFPYLHSLDLEDVNVRRSATGGWHGNYVEVLAKEGIIQGLFAGTDSSSSLFDGLETRTNGGIIDSCPLSPSSIVKDSLFVEWSYKRRRHCVCWTDEPEPKRYFS
jgi:hypothetical protein